MALFILLLFTCTFISRFKCAEVTDIISIYPKEVTRGQLIRRINDTLNLTCVIVPRNLTRVREYKLTWQAPSYSRNSLHRISYFSDRNKVTLVVEKLQESDSGEYKCQAVGIDDQILLTEVVRVNVKQRKPRCLDNFFLCVSSGACIPRHYLCDGKEDCKNGGDEAETFCGRDPCEGKLKCDNDRCIPYSWCCDDYMDPNCTVKVRPQCCPKLTTGDMDADLGYPPSDQQRFNDMGFLQTTIYTVIGCAMAFMFIVTILVIAICRVHMKRSLLSRCPGARLPARGGALGPHGPHHHHAMQHMPLYDLDVLLNRPDMSPHSGLLVTYNINNGVQFVGRPVDPPPYCEVVASPPREGPPPPYASRESLLLAARAAREDEGPGEADSLLGATRQDSPVVGNSTLRLTTVNAATGRDYLDVYGVRENTSPNSRSAASRFSVIVDEAGSPVSNASLSEVANSSSNENVVPTCLLNIDGSRANDDRIPENTNENAVSEYRPLLSGSLAASPKDHTPANLPDEPLCSTPGSPTQPQSKSSLLGHIPTTQENGSFNTRENHGAHLRESFIGLRDGTGPEGIKIHNTLTTAAQDAVTQCESSATDINRTQIFKE